MYSKLIRDYRKRVTASHAELHKRILKLLILTGTDLENTLIASYFHRNMLTGFAKSRRRCLITARSRTYSFYKISRIRLREYAAQGLLLGVRRAAW